MARDPQPSEKNYWIIKWLAAQGPAEWHGVAETWGWGDGVEAPLRWIIQQPDCDRATAATIFWLSEPSYYLAYEGDYEHPIKIMDLEIIERWRAGLYKSSRFDFGGDYMDEHRDGWVKKFDIPESLADPIEGTEAFPGFEKGFPIEIDVAWYNAMGKEPPDWFLERHDLLWDGEKIVGDVPAADLGQMRLTRAGKMTASEVAGAREALADVRTSFSPDDTATRIRALRSKIGEGNETTSEPVNDPRLSSWIRRLFGR
jgi:hypothetical protein